MDIKSLITIEELPTVGSTNPEQEYLLLQTPEKTGKMPLSNLPSEASKIGFDNKGTNLSSNTVQAAITELDSSLNGKVSNFASGNYKAVTGLAYDPTNKKLGLKVGADTVIPFNGGKTVVSGFYNRNNVATVMYIPLKVNESVTAIACDYNSNGSTSNGLTIVIPSNKDSFKLTLKNETTSTMEIVVVAQTNDSGSYVPIKDNNVRVTIPSKSSISFNSDDYPTMIGFSLYWYTGFDKGVSVIIE